jgi:hypothetical protein
VLVLAAQRQLLLLWWEGLWVGEQAKRKKKAKKGRASLEKGTTVSGGDGSDESLVEDGTRLQRILKVQKRMRAALQLASALAWN